MNLLFKALLPYIINGLAISPAASPIVKLELIQPTGESYFCSGSLISDAKILTAAHCFRSYDSRIPFPVAAVVKIDGITYSSIHWKIHPKFRPDKGYTYDMAIVTLSEPVDKLIPRLAIDTKKPKKGIPYLVYGYGYSNGFTDPDILRIGVIVFDRINREMLGSTLKPGESSACFGDSGGPVISPRGIIGVVTAGEYYCDRIGSESIYGRINNRYNRQFVKQFGK